MNDNLKDYRLGTAQDGPAEKSKVFCLIPWIHLFVLPSARIIPCCISNYNLEYGYLNNQSLKRIWNNKRIRKMRMNMLNDQPCEECAKCYEWETIDGYRSYRKIVNERYSSQYYLVNGTKDGGYLENITLKYIQIVYSNVCNFRCRTCKPLLSSGWHDDFNKISNKKKAFSILKLGKAAENFNKYLDKSSGEIEEFYFAGGEPILSDDYYRILDKLLSLHRNDTRLRYNTNLSSLTYKNKNILDYWKKFSHITVFASLDAFGPRGELIRKGQNWKKTEANIKKLKKECPHIIFNINPTVSLMNIWHLPDFHKYMLEKEFIGINDIYLNILSGPLEYNAQLLPAKFKENVTNRLTKHIDFLVNNGGQERMVSKFRHLITFINKKDLSSKYNEFLEMSKKLDTIRHENFVKVFPEFKGFY